MKSVITESKLKELTDFDAHERMVVKAVTNAFQNPVSTLQFVGRYASWNGFFGSGVATMCGKIGRCRGSFLDPDEKLIAAADRSVYVASFFFDSARDEFKEHTNAKYRDTHRCLAQAMVKGTVQYACDVEGVSFAEAQHVLLNEPEWLTAMNRHVAVGYGSRSKDDFAGVFEAIGFHLGSELLADREFSVLDKLFQEKHPKLYEYLNKTEIQLVDHPHNAFQWIKIHSGEGGAAEADHFLWATQGVTEALKCTPEVLRESAVQHVHAGFVDFANQHEKFFKHVNQ